jgi:antitoxin MazE
MQVARQDNSLVVRLPSVVDALKLKEGDEIEIHVVNKVSSACRAIPSAMSS